MKTQKVNIHSQQYMETMARLMSEAIESPEGLRALAAAIAGPIEQEIARKGSAEKENDPVNRFPAERRSHGWRRPGFFAKQDSEAKKWARCPSARRS